MNSLKMFRNNQSGEIGYILLWLLGIPIPILIVLFLVRGLHMTGVKYGWYSIPADV